MQGDLRSSPPSSPISSRNKREGSRASNSSNDSIDAENELMVTLKDRVDAAASADRQGRRHQDPAVSMRSSPSAAATAQLAGDIGKRDQAIAAVKSVDKQIAETIDELRLRPDPADGRRHAGSPTRGQPKRVKAKVRIDRMTMRSPVDGIVQSLGVTTIGQVVTTGQELMSIVPSDAPPRSWPM